MQPITNSSFIHPFRCTYACRTLHATRKEIWHPLADESLMFLIWCPVAWSPMLHWWLLRQQTVYSSSPSHTGYVTAVAADISLTSCCMQAGCHDVLSAVKVIQAFYIMRHSWCSGASHDKLPSLSKCYTVTAVAQMDDWWKVGMHIIHRSIKFYTTTEFETRGAHCTQGCVILEALWYIHVCCIFTGNNAQYVT